MLLFAALVPPPRVIDELWSLADAAPEVVRPPRPVGWRASRPTSGRWGRRRDATDPGGATGPLAPPLDLEPPERVTFDLARFGNLTHVDAERLVGALTEAARDWPAPRLRLAGCATVESEEDPSVWVDLAGELDELGEVVRGVPRTATAVRLYVDRRVFQPTVRLGRVNPGTSVPQLEQLLATLADFEGTAWLQESFSLLTHSDRGPGEPPFTTYAEIPLRTSTQQ